MLLEQIVPRNLRARFFGGQGNPYSPEFERHHGITFIGQDAYFTFPEFGGEHPPIHFDKILEFGQIGLEPGAGEVLLGVEVQNAGVEFC